MLNDRDDPILDVCLEETLGGKQPPDLSARILAAWHASQQRGSSNGATAAPVPALRPIPLSTAAPATIVERRSRRSVWRVAWLPLALAASLLLAVGGFWFVRQKAGGPVAADPLIADSQDAPQHAATQNGAAQKVVADSNAVEKSRESQTPKNSIASQSPVANEAVRAEENRERVRPEKSAPKKLAPGSAVAQDDKQPAHHRPAGDASSIEKESADGPNVAERSVASASPLAAVSASATSDAEITAYIDRMLRTRWQEASIRPSPAATDAEWCRRVFLDLIGRIPTIAELEAFLVDNSRDKRARLVDELLNADDYAESYARHWTTIWTTMLVGRNGGMEPNSPVNREGLQQYLRRSFLHNKPYDRLVYELISAQGSNRPGEPDFNGAVNFVLDNLQEKAATATVKTAQIFLGVQIQCTQCHNHPFNEWKQNRFWELNAFFRQTRAVRELQGNQRQLVRLVDEDFAGEGDSPDPSEAEIYYELRNGLMQVAYPVFFIDGTELGRSGLVSDVNRRDELARLVVRSDEFSQAIVNRLWAHFFGHGFTRPYDDLGTHNPPSHPELFARLGREFAAHGHDLKRLLRWIALSEAYSLSSKFGSKFGNAADDPTLGVAPLFSHFYLRQMTAEQLYDSLLAATEAQAAERGGYEQQQRTKDEWLKQFAITFGTDENNEATTFDGTIAQALMMMNGELTRQATSVESDSFLGRVARQGAKSNPIHQLYLAALGRRPSRAELQLANGLLASRGGNAATVLEDVWWALLNSNEFILNH